MTVRALALAAVACFAIPLMPSTTFGQDEAPAPTEVVVEATVAVDEAPAEDAPAEGSYEAFMAGPDAAMFTVNNDAVDPHLRRTRLYHAPRVLRG